MHQRGKFIITLLLFAVWFSSMPPSLYAQGDTRPQLVGAESREPYSVTLKYDQNIRPYEDGELEAGKDLFIIDQPDVRVSNLAVEGTRVTLRLNRPLPNVDSVSLQAAAGAAVGANGLASKPEADYQVMTMGGKLALQDRIDPAGERVTFRQVMAYLTGALPSNIVGPEGIGQEDVRYLLALTRPDEARSTAAAELSQLAEEVQGFLASQAAREFYTLASVEALQAELVLAEQVLQEASASSRQIMYAWLKLFYANQALKALPVQEPAEPAVPAPAEPARPLEVGTDLWTYGANEHLERVDGGLYVPAAMSAEELKEHLQAPEGSSVDILDAVTGMAVSAGAVNSDMIVRVQDPAWNAADYSIRIQQPVSTFAELQAAAARSDLEAIKLMSASLSSSSEVLRFDSSVELRSAVDNVDITALRYEGIIPTLHPGITLTANASTDNQLRSAMNGIANQIIVHGLEGYPDGIITRLPGGFYAYYNKETGQAFAHTPEALIEAVQEIGVSRVYVTNDISLAEAYDIGNRSLTLAGEGRNVYGLNGTAIQLEGVALPDYSTRSGPEVLMAGEPYLSPSTTITFTEPLSEAAKLRIQQAVQSAAPELAFVPENFNWTDAALDIYHPTEGNYYFERDIRVQLGEGAYAPFVTIINVGLDAVLYPVEWDVPVQELTVGFNQELAADATNIFYWAEVIADIYVLRNDALVPLQVESIQWDETSMPGQSLRVKLASPYVLGATDSVHIQLAPSRLISGEGDKLEREWLEYRPIQYTAQLL
ncbi:hypothetical protein [Paenibacillus tarimensis]|uniref:hypothetical protein n=1 Tax=Paenibacillus tarimensis TaxID=416012 RepID=UPI001F1BA997|nr:hypothetical protein [Paenibacillus tarimensis]MCF2945838.1 hypothetical protein [Paenibacillus tarimensis]